MDLYFHASTTSIYFPCFNSWLKTGVNDKNTACVEIIMTISVENCTNFFWGESFFILSANCCTMDYKTTASLLLPWLY